jgi:uncharacterized protein (DUF1800 family)
MRVRLFVYSIASLLLFSPDSQAFNEQSFEIRLRESLKSSSLTPTQKARHILNRMGYGGNPLSETQRLDKLNSDKAIIDFMKEQLANLSGSTPPSPVDDVLEASLSVDPKALCQRSKDRKDERGQLIWCREGLTNPMAAGEPGTITGKIKKLSDVVEAKRAASDLSPKDPTLKEQLETAMRNYSNFAGGLHWALKRQQAAKAIIEEDYVFRRQLFDFWANHFNVTLDKIGSKRFFEYIPVIENNISGSFHQLLSATAHSPAMLVYLENFRSGRLWKRVRAEARSKAAKSCPRRTPNRLSCIQRIVKRVISEQGVINENYARELIELHTFGEGPGVNYGQHAVQEASKILSGWAVRFGEVDTFQFIREYHVGGKKQLFLKPTITIRGGAQEEGELLLTHLANHPATAKNISQKLVKRFVSENMEHTKGLVQKMTQSFSATRGDLLSLYRIMLSSPEFWAEATYESKAVRPFDRYVRIVRGLGIKVNRESKNYQSQVERLKTLAEQVTNRSRLEGQDIFSCTPPTGYPDDSSHWLSVGSAVRSITNAFLIEDLAYNAWAFSEENPDFASNWTPEMAHSNFWHFFIQNASSLSASSPNRIFSASEATVLSEEIDRRFDFELLTGRRARLYNLDLSKLDRINVRGYTLLPARTELTLYFGSEQASKY